MKKTVKKIVEILISLSGTVLGIYVAGYWLLYKPLKNLYIAYLAHAISWGLLLNSFIRIFFCATVFGAIWCIFDILAGFFREEEEL